MSVDNKQYYIRPFLDPTKDVLNENLNKYILMLLSIEWSS
jgi:hypothetical protein